MNEKPVRCGCGGEAVIDQTEGYDEYQVYCPKCFMQSGTYDTEAEAVKAWNLAMGASDINVGNKFAKDMNVPNKERTAKVENQESRHIYWIGDCNECQCEVDSYMNYCPNCGARLEWK